MDFLILFTGSRIRDGKKRAPRTTPLKNQPKNSMIISIKIFSRAKNFNMATLRAET